MNFLLSFMVCFFTLAASDMTDELGYDIEKCSISYIRHLVEESCVRHLRARREEERVYNISLQPGTPHRFNLRPIVLPIVDPSRFPKNLNMTLVAKKRTNTKVRRAAGEDHSIYFVFCCEHMDICENLDCP